MSSRLTLQINSLEALERLIGGDTEVEMGIRNSIVQAFVTKHLKGIAQVLVDNHIEKKCKDIFEETLKGNKKVFTLKETYSEKLREAVDNEFDEIFKFKFNKLKIEEWDKQIEKISNDVIDRIQSEYFRAKVKDVVKKKLENIKNAADKDDEFIL